MSVRSYLLFFLCMAVSLASSAQRRRPHAPPIVIDPPKTGWLLSTNLQSLHDFDAGPSLAVEYRYSKYWGVVIEGMAVMYQGLGSGGSTPHWFRVQPELRFYFPGRYERYRGFFSLQAAYKQTSYQQTAMVERNPNTNRTSWESVDYEERKYTRSIAGNIGFQARLGKSQRFMLECYGGLGVKSKNFGNRPANMVKASSLWLSVYQAEDGDFIHIPMGFRLGYRL